MSTDFSGSNSDKIDKLIVASIELRTTLRICFAIVGIGFPMMIGLMTFLVIQSSRTSAKVDRLSAPIALVSRDSVRLAERVERLDRLSRP